MNAAVIGGDCPTLIKLWVWLRLLMNEGRLAARAFALDTRSKRRWESKPITDETAAAFRSACAAFGYPPSVILPHGSYLINLASTDHDMVGCNWLVKTAKQGEFTDGIRGPGGEIVWRLFDRTSELREAGPNALQFPPRLDMWPLHPRWML